MLCSDEASQAARPTAVTVGVEEMRVGSLQSPLITNTGNGQRAGTFRAPKHENMQEFLHIILPGVADSSGADEHPMFL
jgi:hypothetical protein